MTQPEKENKIYFEHLDVIRFIAAYMIIILHSYEAWQGWFVNSGMATGPTLASTSIGKYVELFIHNLGIGVDIFFLISGFLITYLLLEEKKKFGTIHIGKFMMRRILRIWPLYFLLIAVAPLLVYMTRSNTPNYLANIFFVGNFDIIQRETWEYPFSHFWSICVEEHFYLLWPFVILYIPQKHLLSFFGGLISLSIGFRIYSFVTMGYSWYTIYLHTLSRMDVLIIGAIGAFYYSNKPFKVELNRTLRLLLLAILVIILCIESEPFWNSMLLAGFKKFLYIGIISLLLLDYNFNPNFKHILKKNSLIHYLGKVSYGIYMYGNLLLLFVIKIVIWRVKIYHIGFFFLVVTLFSLGVPILSYELFEKRFLKWTKHFRLIDTQR